MGSEMCIRDRNGELGIICMVGTHVSTNLNAGYIKIVIRAYVKKIYVSVLQVGSEIFAI